MNALPIITATGLLITGFIPAAPAQPEAETRTVIGWSTNGFTVLQSWRHTKTITNIIPARPGPPGRTNLTARAPRIETREWSYTNVMFHSYVPGSLAHLIWTNHIAATNRRDMQIWAERGFPPDWQRQGPNVRWNTNSLIYGMRGFTALSPAWLGQSGIGQVPVTALTRRHAYARGHGMGEPGFNTSHAGRRIWFLTAANRKVTATVTRAVVRCHTTNQMRFDYTILLLDRDLPPEIEPLAVTATEQVQKFLTRPPQAIVPLPIFETEQGGYVSTGVSPLTVNTWKGGDSGSPNMIPLPGELVFYSGRSTSGPSPEMQADMDELCRQDKLNPAKYQLRWVDLEKFGPKP